jgi:hypothetical protein
MPCTSLLPRFRQYQYALTKGQTAALLAAIRYHCYRRGLWNVPSPLFARSSICGLWGHTDYNPNVMYEVGMAIALGKSIILLSNIDYNEKLEKALPSIPFDTKDTYIYDYKISDLKELITAIYNKIETL